MTKPVKREHITSEAHFYTIFSHNVEGSTRALHPHLPLLLLPVALTQIYAKTVQRDLIWHHISQPLKTETSWCEWLWSKNGY